MQRRNHNLQTFKMESLATILDGLQLTIIVAKPITLDVSGDPGYASYMNITGHSSESSCTCCLKLNKGYLLHQGR